MKTLKTVVLSEEDFQTLFLGGFFVTILRHPEVEVFHSQGDVTVHIPGHGAVQMKAVE